MRFLLAAGYLFAAGAAISYAVAQVASRKIVLEIAPPLVLSFYSFLFSAFFLLLYFLPRLRRDLRLPNRPRGLLFFAANGISGALGVTALYFALQHSPVAVVSSVSSSNPLIAVFFSYLFLSHLEKVTPRILLGTLLVVVGVVLVTLSQL